MSDLQPSKKVKKATGTREWMPHSENCMLGCENDCRYCYAGLRAARFKQRDRKDWHIMEPNLRRLNRPVNYLEGGVMFPTSHDLHMKYVNFWSPFLTDLLNVGNRILIVSKPRLDVIRFICDNFTTKKNQIEFRFTIGTISEIARQFWEPGAPPIGERIQALRYAYERGYKTSVSMEPLLERDPRNLIAFVEPWISEDGTIWIGTMNHITNQMFPAVPESRKFYERQILINSRENMQRVYDSLQGIPKIRWKDSVQELLGISQNGERA